jgi:2',3'-cyclic-nucleotide 2'-phosphodiesterase (5'-nucleotidase family)
MMRKLMGGALAFCLLLGVASCKSSLQVEKAEGWMIPVDSKWDAKPNNDALELIGQYKQAVDSVMGVKLGESEMLMTNSRPEDCLQNLVADVLRDAAIPTLGRPADMGLMNIGGLRNVLPKGDITLGTAFEILPFENTLCVMEVDGATLRDLLAAVAARGGEGVSGVNIVMDKNLKLVDCSVDGKSIEDSKIYTVSTIDYLAGGNDGMTPLLKAKSAVCPENGLLRDVFIRYVKKMNAAGKKLTSRTEGRIVVK